MEYYTGLDVSNNTTAICVIDSKRKIIFEMSVESCPQTIVETIKALNLNMVRIGLEAGCFSHFLVKEMATRGLKVICVESRRMAAVLATTINKTDRNDARGIAEALRAEYFTEVHHKSDESVEINMTLNARGTLVKNQTQIKNTIRGLLKTFGIRFISGKSISEFIENASKASEVLSPMAKTSIECLLKVLSEIAQQISLIDKPLLTFAKTDSDCILLQTVPGVGPITALAFKSTVDNPERFANSKDVAAYIGLTPKQYASGETLIQSSVSKCGSGSTRALLTGAATSMLIHCKTWSLPRGWAMKLAKSKGLKKARVALARKLAVIMHRMLITKQAFRLGKELEKGSKSKTKRIAA